MRFELRSTEKSMRMTLLQVKMILEFSGTEMILTRLMIFELTMNRLRITLVETNHVKGILRC